MKAAVFKGSGGIEVITIVQRPLPKPQRGEELVRVKNVGLNRAEILQRKGLYAAPKGMPKDIPGLEFAGEVPDSKRRVMGITGGGSQAEFLTVPEELLITIPEKIDYITAAAIPEAYITASDAVYTQLQIKPEETVLIHAVGSSVGIALLQILKNIGCRVIGTSRTQEKLDKAKHLGLSLGINTAKQDFKEIIKQETRGKGVHAIIDFIGAPFLEKNIDSLMDGGRLLILGLIGGIEAKINLNKILPRRLQLLSANMRTRPQAEKAAATKIFMIKTLPLIAEGKIKPVIDRVFKLEELAQAHHYMEENRNFGKIIIRVE